MRASANNGQCEDGGPVGSIFYTDKSGKQRAACGFATDRTDCEKAGELRRMTSLGGLSFVQATTPFPPYPDPPPSPPHPPPLRRPRARRRAPLRVPPTYRRGP